MIVYADVLIVLNLIVDYFLLKVSARLARQQPSTIRLLISALMAALFSLYIFLPSMNLFYELCLRLVTNSIIVLTAFGFQNLKRFLMSSGIFLLVTCAYGGIMIAVWQIWKPASMVINNSVVYFDISPTVLVCCSVVAYLGFCVCSKLFSFSAKFAKKCDIKISAQGQSVTANAIIDTGNSISDVFGKSEIIIADKAVLISLFGTLDTQENDTLITRYRTIPCGTVSGGGLMDGYRCDSAEIYYENKTIRISKPLLALSKMPLKDGYSAILNPKILSSVGEIDDTKNKKITL